MQISELEDTINNVSSDNLRNYAELRERIDDLERVVKALADKVNEVIDTVNKNEEKQ